MVNKAAAEWKCACGQWIELSFADKPAHLRTPLGAKTFSLCHGSSQLFGDTFDVTKYSTESFVDWIISRIKSHFMLNKDCGWTDEGLKTW